MRSLRPSLTIALFAGSVAAIACGGDSNDDDSMKTTVSDAAAVTAPGAPGAVPGGGGLDAGILANLPFDAAGLTGLLDSAVVTGFVDGLYDSGVLSTTDAGGLSINQAAICRTFPAACQDGALSIPAGFPGGGGSTGLTGGGSTGLTGGGAAAGAGGTTSGTTRP